MTPRRAPISDESAHAAGYQRCDANAVIFPAADYFYQRLVRDSRGTCYFLELVHYPTTRYTRESWMGDLTLNEPHTTFQRHGLTSIRSFERQAAAVWTLLGSRYYARP